MLTEQQIQMLKDALDMAIQSNRRARNTRTQPEFQPIYAKIIRDLEELKSRLDTLSVPNKK